MVPPPVDCPFTRCVVAPSIEGHRAMSLTEKQRARICLDVAAAKRALSEAREGDTLEDKIRAIELALKFVRRDT